ncbi:F-box protein At2g39490-like [Neltuma alba]|uniref:F-box protein At2g39490-like n=1 Tax=Neltuma alba TaxID=207710 RepID=UPI0010A2BCDA|nr:F-box protein At2g39490-like [Prosopis alba]
MEDMFSSLPDEILGHVVSFLPNESALYTSLLSTRWRDLWNETLVRYGTAEDMADSVVDFLARFEELHPLKHPRRLQFHYVETEDSVLLASIATNNKLLLDFSGRKKREEPEGPYEMRLKLNIQNPQSFPPPTFSIKTLYLKSVCCLTSEVVSSVVSSLQHLENLIITGCDGLESLCIVDGETKLVKLTILDCLQLKSLQLRTCRLKYFRYRGLLPRILPENFFNLADAMLDFRLGHICYNFKTEHFDTTLLTIKNSEVLTLCEWNYRALIWPSISPQIESFIFYKLKELWWIVKDGQSSDALVSFLKLCPALQKLYVTVDPESYFTSNPAASGLKEATKYKKLEHLRLVKLMGFTRKEDEISLAKDLIQLVKAKPPRIDASDGSCLQVLGNTLSEHKERCELVRLEKEINVCAKHPHMGL